MQPALYNSQVDAECVNIDTDKALRTNLLGMLDLESPYTLTALDQMVSQVLDLEKVAAAAAVQ